MAQLSSEIYFSLLQPSIHKIIPTAKRRGDYFCAKNATVYFKTMLSSIALTSSLAMGSPSISLVLTVIFTLPHL